MPISLDTFILGGTTDEIFVTVLDDVVLINDFKININALKISSLKEVDVGKDKLKDVDTEEKIRSKLRGEKMIAGNLFTDYFKVDQPVDRNVHIIIAISTTGKCLIIFSMLKELKEKESGQEFYTTRFTSEEIKNLFTQYVEENKLNVDVDEIVADIYSLTLGHKDLNENEIEILTEVLYHGTKQLLEDIKNKKDVQFLLAEGIIVKVPHTNYEWMIIECAAPILRNIMLSRIHRPTIKHSSPIDTTNIDPEWLLARTIEVREYDEEGQRHQRLNILIHE
ncbi:hypothetical protein GLOIN_2v1763493 [Rhizophagus irregularis DAOM 181602=DAOM 197198]|uniref:Uncharacterized protein n=1 Tax=Rhizophagus irregularis (strain DAOM 181602 / DAOM 197198 / MUCL 43194) TaxID=747089 RepID=A0A2P4QUE2_RHIID|nr:hypothetical protein GLOIN_2v1763493 [Rhizophagus irregularis DAOM 181602=DAOM 197198]POG81265.1 hypothetical protein GLOIN_2v1763493 [Rhizophagus irregularis DAOM 181602=DAOM 197198]|eukprot:XP_025188131.1 hypothetical protein GLOIN_2v1763493 [Rhizophagus irregularis DAOM 181602=DAOM 197198]